MERYSSLSQSNHSWIDDMSQTVTKMPPIENGIQAKIQMENATVTIQMIFQKKNNKKIIK